MKIIEKKILQSLFLYFFFFYFSLQSQITDSKNINKENAQNNKYTKSNKVNEFSSFLQITSKTIANEKGMRSPIIVASLDILTNSPNKLNENEFILHPSKAPLPSESASASLKEAEINQANKPSGHQVEVISPSLKEVDNESNDFIGDTKAILEKFAIRDQKKLEKSLKNHKDETEKVHVFY